MIMRVKIKRILKSNRIVYLIYSVLGSIIIYVLKLFVKKDPKLILFVCYGGKKYDDSPKVISEYISKSEEYKDYRLIWAFENPERFNISGVEKIKIDTIRYYIILLRANYWITNTTVKRGLRFTNKDIFYLNTSHGTPIKKIGNDVKKGGQTFKSIDTNNDISMILSQSKLEVDIFTSAFSLDRKKVILTGLPRNDELVSIKKEDKARARKKLGINDEKKVILYAPTFREYDKDKKLNCYIKPPVDFAKWISRLGDEYMILIRAHHEVGKVLLKSNYNEFVLNVSDYDNINELMIASDILISDYSSIFFDYSLLKRPMLCYAYDLDRYSRERGLYYNMDELIPGGIIETEEALIERIIDMDYDLAVKETERFCNNYINESGNACEKVITAMLGS